MKRATPLLALLVAAFLYGCGEHDKKPDPARPRLDNESIVFPPGSAQIGSFSSEIVKPVEPTQLRIPGRIVWDEERTVRVYPPYAGRVDRILVKAGDTVSRGQTLAILASPDYGQTQAESRRASTDLALAAKNLERLRELNANGVAARKDLQAAEADHARAASEFERASAKLKLYGGSTEAVDQTFPIHSPLAGVVVERNINPGQELRPDLQLSNAPAIFVITDPSHLWVQLDATERDLHELAVRKVVKLRTSAWPNEEFEGRIDAISDFVDPTTRTVKVRGSLSNPQRKLKGEMFITADLKGDTATGVEVHSKAVLLVGDKQYAFLEEAPGRFLRVEVKTGGEHDGKVSVTSGLSAGQRVVVEGSLFLQRIHQQLRGAESS